MSSLPVSTQTNFTQSMSEARTCYRCNRVLIKHNSVLSDLKKLLNSQTRQMLANLIAVYTPGFKAQFLELPLSLNDIKERLLSNSRVITTT